MSPTDKYTKDWWNWRFGVFGFIACIVVFISSFIEELVSGENVKWVRGSAMIFAVIILLALLYNRLIDPYKRVHRIFVHIVPWLLLICVILNTIIYWALQPIKQTTIKFDKGKGAIFNSYDHHPGKEKFIYAFGEPKKLMWVIDQEGAAYFSYKTDTSIQSPDSLASSGGYITFYAKPCDRLIFREISFTCKATNTKGEPDVGVRIAVDDPNATGDRERIMYEISSINTYHKRKKIVDEKWQTFTIDLGDFEQKRIELPLPHGIDENTINKIVFFVNKQIVNKCPEGTLWFRDLSFKTDKG